MSYRESGASWRPLWIVLALLLAAVVLDVVLPGADHVLAWIVVVPVLAGIFGLSVIAGRRVWSVQIDDDELRVGQDTLALNAIDSEHLQSIVDGGELGGVDIGARVLGGGWSIPKGRTGLPLRRTDGVSVLVPTRDPAALSRALLDRLHA